MKLFASGCSIEELAPEDCRVLPKATVQVAQPVALSARLCDHPACGCEPYCRIPEGICQRYGGDFDDRPSDYEFSGNGILFADRSEKPAMQEVRYYYGTQNRNR